MSISGLFCFENELVNRTVNGSVSCTIIYIRLRECLVPILKANCPNCIKTTTSFWLELSLLCLRQHGKPGPIDSSVAGLKATAQPEDLCLALWEGEDRVFVQLGKTALKSH